MGIGTTPAYTQSTLTLRSTFGGSSSTNLDMVGPGSSGWQNQIRFLASSTAVRHAIVDDYGTNDLLISPGLGGGGVSVVRTNGKIEVGAGVANPNRSTYNGSLFVRGDGVALDIFNQQATTGWNSQIRFSGNSGIRHLIADDFTSNNLIIKVGNGGGANTKLLVDGNQDLTGNLAVSGTGNFAEKVRIGATAPTGSYTSYMLGVDGDIVAKKVIVQTTSWADEVFEENYKLATLEEVGAFIKQHKHLPEIPSEKEVLENGVSLGEMNKLLLKKVEELTLYMIAQQNQVNELMKK